MRLWIFVFRLPRLLRRCNPPPPAPPSIGFGGARINAAFAIGSVLNRDKPVLVHRIWLRLASIEDGSSSWTAFWAASACTSRNWSAVRFNLFRASNDIDMANLLTQSVYV